MESEALYRAAEYIQEAELAVALTGAGLSTRSGIPDFRTQGSGLWEQDDPMQVASFAAFRSSPARFYRWLAPLISAFEKAAPNAAHYALARLEETGFLYSVITQNIDLLHRRAGSKTVHEVHGSMKELVCMTCFATYPCNLAETIKQLMDGIVPTCELCGGVLKPNVTLFGEQLPAQALEAAQRDTRRCDLMIVAGSSMEVYPVADLPRRALARGAKLILINFNPTSYDSMADLVIQGDVAEVLPEIVRIIESSQ